MKLFRRFAELLSFLQMPRADRRLVFYSEGASSWPHLEGLLRELLERFEGPICYLSSSDDDPGLALEHPRLRGFLTDSGPLRKWLFENLEADVVVMTTPDLGSPRLKRSRHRVHYVYVQHSLVSLHMIYRPGAFDQFDTVMCAGPHHLRELRALEQRAGLPEKRAIEHGYGRLDRILADAHPQTDRDASSQEPVHVLVAPSWGPSCVIDSAGERIVSLLLEHGFRVTLRPHPQTVRLSKGTIEAILARHAANASFDLDLGIAGWTSLIESDVMLSDWSGAALDYAFGLGKSVVFLDVERKINNPEYAELGLTPIEESIRNQIGCVVAPDDDEGLIAAIRGHARRRLDLESIMREHVFHVGAADRVGAEAVMELLEGSRERSK